MSRYLPRAPGYPFYWDEFGQSRQPMRRPVPVRAAEPRPQAEPMRDEAGLLREKVEALQAELAAKETEVEALQAELAAKGTEVDELDKLAKQHRLRAVDAENEIELAKDRIRRESAKELEQRRRAFVTELLEVMDDLDRALAAARGDERDAALVQGVELVRKSFLAKLGAHAIHHCPSEGRPFDPERHQAVSTSPVDDPELAGVVVAVAREGYLIGDETLRPANVVVGKYTPAPSNDGRCQS